MACMTRFAFARSASLSSSLKTVGTTCQERPYLSLSHPHGPSSPPAESLVQHSSTSCCDVQSTTNDTASVNLYCGPPFNAMKGCPSSSKTTVITPPLGPGPASP